MELVHKAEGKKWLNKWYKADIDNVTEAKNMAKYWPQLDVVSAEFKGMSFAHAADVRANVQWLARRSSLLRLSFN